MIDQYDHKAMKQYIHELIEASPIVSTCQQDCDNEIRQAEIDLGVASESHCAGCVLNEVANMCSW